MILYISPLMNAFTFAAYAEHCSFNGYSVLKLIITPVSGTQ